ncbi:MAG: MBL fold metallo-hydrolase [bacterium]
MSDEATRAILLGTAQDAGYPSIGCRNPCCEHARLDHALHSHPACLALCHPDGRRWLIDCTPEFPRQLAMLDGLCPPLNAAPDLAGILLTHAHIGHYTGLMHLGREALATPDLPVYGMPRLLDFLRSNGPWDQLVRLGNISLRELQPSGSLELAPGLNVEALPVPHRAEYSETVAFRISGTRASLLYLPDVDNWEDCQPPIEELLQSVDHALLDGTFFSGSELPGRDMRQIPHPTVSDSLRRFAALPQQKRCGIHFFHLNHSNPLLQPGSEACVQVEHAGMQVARPGQEFLL